MLRNVPQLRRLAWVGLAVSGLALLLAAPGATAASSEAGRTATPDVFIADTNIDNGAEPSTVSEFWRSPAIKVCPWTPAVPPVECPTSTDNMMIGGSYYVWITLSNKDILTAAVGSLELRRTNPGGGTNWNTDWSSVGIKLDVTVPANGVLRLPIQFDNVPGPGHFCLAALWDADGDELKPFPANHDKIVVNDNNIAQRNVNSVAIGKGQTVNRSFSIASNEFAPTHTSLIFNTIDTPFQFDGGEIVVDLGPVLFPRWQRAGSWGTGIVQVGPTQLMLVSLTAKIEQLPLNPVERVMLGLQFTADSGMPVGGVYGLDVGQGKPSVSGCNDASPCQPPADRPSIGGVRYTITVVA